MSCICWIGFLVRQFKRHLLDCGQVGNIVWDTLHVWGCHAKIRIYNPQEKKLDARIISGYFTGYPGKSKRHMFYCPTHSTRIVEIGNVRFIQNGETSGSEASWNVEIKEVRVRVPLTSTSISRIVLPHVDEPHNNQEKQINDSEVNNEPVVE